MNQFPAKFLGIRDKSLRDKIPRDQTKSAHTADKKPRPLIAETIKSLFKNDDAISGTTREGTKEYYKIKDVQDRLDELGITNVTVDHIKDVLATKYARGDPVKTVEYIDIEQKSCAGIIIPYDPHVKMVGAENHANVTCYLDSLLFSMFAKSDAFECMLKNNFPEDEAKTQLVNLLRIWVNMLRSGKLIPADLMAIIQDALDACGWPDYDKDTQQDTSEAFTFLTETLSLPLLSLQVDLFHGGKKDESDKKVVYERLLHLSVPEESNGKVIKLEDCLEDYFNGKVDIMRDEENKKSATDDSTPTRNTNWLADDEIQSSPQTSLPSAFTPTFSDNSRDQVGNIVTMQRIDPVHQGSWSDPNANGGKGGSERRPSTRNRSASVIQSILIEESGRRTNMSDSALLQKATGSTRRSTVVKAVAIPAWQFFRLIPFHAGTKSKTEPENDKQVAMNFDQRPVVGICLKRYTMSESGRCNRHDTYIDIPDSVRLPHFMLADGSTNGEKDSTAWDSDYKLVLQSVVCHRGTDLENGHYISFARVAPKLLTDNRRHDLDPPPDYEEAVWARFDDLDTSSAGRVSYVDDIKEALKQEMPYLLFYQVVPMVDAPSTDNAEPGPPSYEDFRTSAEFSRKPPKLHTGGATSWRNEIDFGDTPSMASLSVQTPTTKPQSKRFSGEVERARKSQDGRSCYSRASSIYEDSRRQSMNLTDSLPNTPDAKGSPLMGAADETTASRFSRAAAIFTKGKQSRPASQTGENRITSAMRNFGLIGRPSKEQLVDRPPPFSLNPDIVAYEASEEQEANKGERRSSEFSRDSERLPVETENPTPNGKERPSKSKLKGRPKEKLRKEKGKEKSREKTKEKERADSSKSDDSKADEQPERECTVM